MATFPLDLLKAAIIKGWTRDQVVSALLGRIARDRAYLAYRARKGMHSAYDDQTTLDLEVLVLAATWLTEVTPDEAESS